MLIQIVLSYNSTIWGPSGNITINGTLTFGNDSIRDVIQHPKRGLGAAAEPDVDLNNPPYTIHDGLLYHAACSDRTDTGGCSGGDIVCPYGVY